MVNRTRMLAEFCQLVSLYCPTRGEREVAAVLTGKLSALGLTVAEDDVGGKIGGNCGNLIAYWPGTASNAPVLMFTAHMDSVEPCRDIQPQLQDGVIRSNGQTILGADDKAGIAAILEGIRLVIESGAVHGAVQVVFTVAEEGGLNGAANMDRRQLQADFGYALDSGGAPGTIITMAPGQHNITATLYGKSTHAGVAPEDGRNAIAAAANAISQMRQGRIDGETTANVGIIRGGTATNIVPDKAEIFCEARSRNRDKLEQQTHHMRQAFEAAAERTGCRAEVAVTKAYEAYVLQPNDRVVRVAAQAATAIGLAPVLEATGGGSDANFFNSFGVPTAVLGVGMSKVHSTEEYIREDDLYRCAEWIAAIITTVVTS